MEPSSSRNLSFAQVDLTTPQMRDIGWQNGSSNIILRIMDAPGQGFNDPALGAQRVAAMQLAANVWAARLRSTVPINVDVQFQSLTCANGTGTLAQAGANFLYDNFSGAPFSNTWYHGALAESLSGRNLSLEEDDPDPNAGDLGLAFNSQIDNSCLGAGSRFYYGLNGNVPAGQTSFVNVALHEMAHGLGFSTFTNNANGAFFMGQADIYSRFIFDNTQGITWAQMGSNTQRRNSAINTLQVAWSGNQVLAQAGNFLQSAPSLRVTAPAAIAGAYTVGTAAFGPALSNPGITGDLVLAVDGSALPSELCNPVVNPSEVVGKIAVVDRGTCNFTVKVRNAQNAGAVAVVVINNAAGVPPGLGGTDNTIVIPSVGITLADGALIRATLLENPDPGSLAFDAPAFQVNEEGGNATITVRRSGGTNGTVSVDFASSDGSALADEDYASAAGTVTFSDGQGGTRTFQVGILDDALFEGDETVNLALSNPTGGASLGGQSAAVLTILDDDVNPNGALALTSTVFPASEGDGTVVISVERSGGNLGAVSVDFATADGSATAGADYLAAMGTLTFGDGEGGSKAFEVTLIDDELEESPETIAVTLANATGGAVLGTSTATINVFDNELCVPSATNLCLNQGRFRADVAWRDFVGQTGEGQAVPLASDDSGLFYFFDADNLEMLVKVLDGCGFNDRLWVFAAATTNVEYTLTVTDTLTGAVSDYFNPLGVASPAITDIEAFETCSAGGQITGGQVTGEQSSGDLGQDTVAQHASVGSVAEKLSQLVAELNDGGGSIPEKVGACQPDATTLCLRQGRFQVEIDWRDQQNQTGFGQAVGLESDDSGLFYFFSADNLEVLVKVLDGCGFNNRLWVFAAATTNVEYTMLVTDTATGATSSYFNPLGVASSAVTDTDAFATCP